MKPADAVETHRQFWGQPPAHEDPINLRGFKNLVFLGRVRAVEYEALKHDDPELTLYRHEFVNGSVLLTNGKELLIYGDNKITDRGIE